MCYKDSTADKFENHKIKSIGQLTFHEEVRDTQICRIIADYVKTTTAPIKGIKTGIAEESYSVNYLSDTVKDSLEKLEIDFTDGKTNLEAYQALGCRNLKSLKIHGKSRSDTQNCMQKVVNFMNTFTSTMDFQCYKSWEDKVKLSFKHCYVAAKSGDSLIPSIFYVNEVKIKSKNYTSNFEVVDDLFVLKSFADSEMKKLNPNFENKDSGLSQKLVKDVTSSISTSNCLVFSLDSLHDINLTDEVISSICQNDEDISKFQKLIQNSTYHNIKIKDQEVFDSSYVSVIVNELPSTALYQIEQMESLAKGYNIRKFVMNSGFGRDKVVLENTDKLIEALHSKNMYEHCTDFQIDIANEKDLVFILKPLLNFRKIKAIRIMLGKFEEESNKNMIAEYAAKLLKKIHMRLDTFVIRDNSDFRSHRTVRSFICDVQLPEYLIEKVRNNI